MFANKYPLLIPNLQTFSTKKVWFINKTENFVCYMCTSAKLYTEVNRINYIKIIYKSKMGIYFSKITQKKSAQLARLVGNKTYL
jgi:hypothetical protein